MNAFVLKTSTIINLHLLRLAKIDITISDNLIMGFFLCEAVLILYPFDNETARSSMAVGFNPCLERKLPISSIKIRCRI